VPAVDFNIELRCIRRHTISDIGVV
jgi:hypothetical protein